MTLNLSLPADQRAVALTATQEELIAFLQSCALQGAAPLSVEEIMVGLGRCVADDLTILNRDHWLALSSSNGAELTDAGRAYR